jgi:UDP:flavonoid glycosyltransferase YjiC (YdhE family)
VVLGPNEMEAGAIRGSIEKVLCTSGFREAAALIGSSLRAAGGHLRAADEILSFMRSSE